MTSIFSLNHRDLAAALRGKRVHLPDGRIFVITETEGYDRATNGLKPGATKATGIYGPLFDMDAGDVFFPRQRFHILMLIAALDGGQKGGCVLVRAVQVDGKIVDGPGSVVGAIGVTVPKTIGALTERADGSLELLVDGVLEPKIPKGAKLAPKPSGGLTDLDIAPHMGLIAGVYQRTAGEGDTLEAFVEKLKGDFESTEELIAELKNQLG